MIEFLKSLLDIPIAGYYVLFKSTLAPMLWLLIALMCIIFTYVIITG